MSRLVKLLTKHPVRLIKKAIGFEEVYAIGYRPFNSEQNLLHPEDDDRTFRVIPCNQRYWYADPVAFTYKGGEWLFVEQFDRQRQVGAIAVGKISGKKIGRFHTVLTEPYHLSFPMVFSEEGNKKSEDQTVYMVPESSECKSVTIYLAESFPDRWKLIRSKPMEREVVDSVYIKTDEGRWHFLGSEISHEDPLKVRFIQYTLDKERCLKTEEHEENDSRTYDLKSRNAGRTFRHNEKDILPTQESTDTDYGVFLAFNEIIEKDPIRMKLIRRISPTDISIRGINNKNIIGIHSYARSEGLEIIDIRYYRFSLFSHLRRLKRIIRKGHTKSA